MLTAYLRGTAPLHKEDLMADAPLRLDFAWIGSRIRRARERRGWSQKWLGAQVGLAQRTISHIERGEGTGYRLETYWAITQVLELSWTTLLRALPPMTPDPPATTEAQSSQTVLATLLLWLFVA
jgi:transcriptional regulator with XRE-family HTH domain